MSSRDALALPSLMTVEELAELLRTSRGAVYARHARGGIPGALRLGRTLRFDRNDHRTLALGEQCERGRSIMIQLRPWKDSKDEFEVDVIVVGVQGRTLRRRVKAPVTGKSNAERWARTLEQELFAQLLAPEPEPKPGFGSAAKKLPAPTFNAFARVFLDLCETDRLGVNTRMNYDVHLRHYLLPVLGKRRLTTSSRRTFWRSRSRWRRSRTTR